MYVYNIALPCIQFQGLFDIETESLKAEIMVAKNCLKQINKDFDLIHLKSIIEKIVYPNVYKLLQVIYHLSTFFYFIITKINYKIVMKNVSILGGTHTTN